MVLDRALADAEIRSDILAGVAGKDQFHDLALSRTEIRDAIRCILSMGKQLAQNILLLNQLVHLTKQGLFSGERLSQPDFRKRQAAFVARSRATLRAFKWGALTCVRAERQTSDDHVVNLSSPGHPWRDETLDSGTANSH